MKPCPTLVAALGVVALWATGGQAHDRPLTKEEVSAFDEVNKIVLRALKDGELKETALAEADKALTTIDSDILDHLAEVGSYKSLTEPGRAASDRLGRSEVYLRSLRKDLKAAVRVAFWLGEGTPKGLSKAMLSLCSESYDEGFRRAVVVLSSDPRPEVRLCSGIAAEMGTLFSGPEDAYKRVAENLLVDKDPRVAAQFGRWHCCEFRDPVLIDRLVSRFKDKRSIARESIGFMFSGETDVSRAMVQGFASYFFIQHFGLFEDMEDTAKKASSLDSKAHAEWWQAKKDNWFVPNGRNGWTPMFDGVVELELGKAKTLKAGDREVDVCLRSYSVNDGECEPSTATRLTMQDSRLKSEEGLVVDSCAMPFSLILGASDSVFSSRAIVMPTQTAVYRVRLWLWFHPDQ